MVMLGIQRNIAIQMPAVSFPQWHIPGIGPVMVLTPTVFVRERMHTEEGRRCVLRQRFKLIRRGRTLVYKEGTTPNESYSEENMQFV